MEGVGCKRRRKQLDENDELRRRSHDQPKVLEKGRKTVNNFQDIRGLKCVYTNADQLRNKMEELRTRTANTDPHIIGVTEVKPKIASFDITEPEIHIPGYNTFHNSLKTGDGNRGCALYIKSNIDAQQVQLNEEFSDSVWVEIKLVGNDKLLVGCIYRSPNSSNVNNKALRQVLVKATEMKYSHVLLTGDFNFPSINWLTWSVNSTNEEDEAAMFVEAARDGFLYQHIDQPTRIRGENEPSCLDLVFTNEEGMVDNVEIQSPLGKSDHAMITFEFYCYNTKFIDAPQKFQFNRGDYTSMKQELSSINWNEVVSADKSVNEQWKSFSTQVMSNMEKFIPKRKNSGKTKKHLTPLDKNAIRKIKKKHRAWTRYMESRESKHYQIYTRLRSQVCQLTRKARVNQEKTIADDAKTNPPKFWKFAKSQTKTKDGVSNLKDKNDKTTENEQEKAEVLLEQFSSVFTHEPDGEVPVFEPRNLSQEDTKVIITEEEVRKKLEKLNVNKSAGPDGIHPRVFRELSDVLAPPLTIIFNTSLKEKNIPDEWKMAIVSPIYKKGSKQKASNYRPVSLTCIASKIMESFIREHIVNHMKINSLLSNKQFGFLSGRSTVLQLLKVMDDWADILDNSKAKIDVIYMDFQKAFDKVPHKRLISKLKGYGLHQEVQDWVTSFLTGRQHKVCVNGKFSATADVTSGIPQGSVLGPTLFVLYINDLPECVENEVYLFADDTKIYCKIVDAIDAINLQEDLGKLEQWSNKWLLSFHPDKCKVLHLGDKKGPKFVYNMGGTPLQETECEKDLGVKIDNNLKFSQHIDTIVNKANSIMGIIRRTFKHLDQKTFLKLYKALVRPNLEYAVQVWSPYLKKEIRKLEGVQRRATKQINDLRNLDYSDRLKKLKLPTLIYRRKRGDMIEAYKILSDKYDPEVADFLPLHKEVMPNSVTRGNSLKLFKRKSNLIACKQSFSHRIIDEWNNLPEVVVSAPSVNSFKNRLDRYWSRLEVKFNFETAMARLRS